jgi:hypothetical protein
MEFKTITLSNTRAAGKPAASRTDTQRALFVRHQQQNLRGVAQAVSIAWCLTLAPTLAATGSTHHEVWPAR